MKSGKLIRLSDDRSVYIIQDEDDSYIDKDDLIRYRNIGSAYNQSLVEERHTRVTDKGIVEVVGQTGKSIWFFPLIWLDTDRMRVEGIIRDGLVTIGNGK